MCNFPLWSSEETEFNVDGPFRYSACENLRFVVVFGFPDEEKFPLT